MRYLYVCLLTISEPIFIKHILIKLHLLTWFLKVTVNVPIFYFIIICHYFCICLRLVYKMQSNWFELNFIQSIVYIIIKCCICILLLEFGISAHVELSEAAAGVMTADILCNTWKSKSSLWQSYGWSVQMSFHCHSPHQGQPKSGHTLAQMPEAL